MLITLILVIVLLSIVSRLVTSIFRVRHARGYGFSHPYGYGRYDGCSRRHRFGGGLLTILAILAFERLFTRRF